MLMVNINLFAIVIGNVFPFGYSEFITHLCMALDCNSIFEDVQLCAYFIASDADTGTF